MKNLLLVTFSWLMMMAIIGSIIYTMLYVVENYSSGNNETIQYLWCCFTGMLLIPAYKGVYYIHHLWLKMLKEFRQVNFTEEDNKEIPFFKESAPTVSVNISEYPSYENKKKETPSPALEDLNERLRKIRSSANEKLSQIRKEDIANPTKESSYFATKYTGEKSILVNTIFAKEKTASSPKTEPTAKTTPVKKEETETSVEQSPTPPVAAPKKDDAALGDTTHKPSQKSNKKHRHKKGGGKR